jgi:hypothetical protein
MEESYFLPDGTRTKDQQEYFRVWRSMADRLATFFDGKRHSYDPDFTIRTPTGMLEIPLAAANKLVELIVECERLRQENSELSKKLNNLV